MNKRDLRLEDYGISNRRYRELKYFCEQYPEWEKEIAQIGLISGQQLTGMPFLPAGHNSDRTQSEAIKLGRLKDNIHMVDDSLREACGDLAEYIKKNVCYGYRFDMIDCPCEKNCFYDNRRYFFAILNRKRG